MKSLRAGTKLATNLNDMLKASGALLLMPTEDAGLPYSAPKRSSEKFVAYEECLGLATLQTNIHDSTKVRIDIDSWYIKGLREHLGYLAYVPDNLYVEAPEAGEPIFGVYSIETAVKAMSGSGTLNLNRYNKVYVNFNIAEGLKATGFRIYLVNDKPSFLEYQDDLGDWIVATQIGTGTNVYEFSEAIVATNWRVSVDPYYSRLAYSPMNNFFLILEDDGYVEPKREFNSVLVVSETQTSRGGNITDDLPTIHVSSGDLDSGAVVLFESTEVVDGVDPMLVKFELDFVGVGDDKV